MPYVAIEREVPASERKKPSQFAALEDPENGRSERARRALRRFSDAAGKEEKMKIRRKTIYKINQISRLRPGSDATRKKLYRIFEKMISDFGRSSSGRGRSVEIDRRRKFIRKDENVDVMTFYLREKLGGVIMIKIHNLDDDAEMYCRFGDGETFSSNMEAIGKSSIENAEKFLSYPEMESEVVYRLAMIRPMDNLHEIVAILDDAALGGNNGSCTYLCPDYDRTYFDPSAILEAAGLPFSLTEPEFAEGNHTISVPKQFPGWKKHICVIHDAYRTESGKPALDFSKIFITLEVEKRIWAEHADGIGKFLRCIRERIGRPLTIYINGMTATVNRNEIEDFEKIRASENGIVDELAETAPRDTIVKRGFGKTIQEKIDDCRNFGFYIGPFGSSAVVPTVLGMPGITYQNEFFINPRSKRKTLNLPYLTKVDAKHINNLSDHQGVAPIYLKKKGYENSMSICCVGYSIDADVFVKLAFDHYCAVRKHMTKRSIYGKMLKGLSKTLLAMSSGK